MSVTYVCLVVLCLSTFRARNERSRIRRSSRVAGGYKEYLPEYRKSIGICDVKFLENAFHNTSDESESIEELLPTSSLHTSEYFIPDPISTPESFSNEDDIVPIPSARPIRQRRRLNRYGE